MSNIIAYRFIIFLFLGHCRSSESINPSDILNKSWQKKESITASRIMSSENIAFERICFSIFNKYWTDI